MAGTLAAVSDNGIGVAGVSWASLVMPLVVVDDSNYAAYSNRAEAIQYAADHGVRASHYGLNEVAAPARDTRSSRRDTGIRRLGRIWRRRNWIGSGRRRRVRSGWFCASATGN